MNGKRMLALIALLWLGTVLPGSAQTFKIINGWGGIGDILNPDLGQHSSTILYGDLLHIFYFDSYWGTLHHTTYRDQDGYWHEQLDGDWGWDGRINAYLDWNIATAVSGGQLHVFYFDATNGDLRHAWRSTSQSWRFETLDGDGIAPHTGNVVGAQIAAANVQGQLNVFYLDSTVQHLRRAWWNGSRWSYEQFDGWNGADGRINAEVGWHVMALDAGTASSHVFYYNRSSGDLRHARWDTGLGRWVFETLDGAGGLDGRIDANVGWYVEAARGIESIHVFYHDRTSMDLRHATYGERSNTWTFETVDGNDSQSGRTFNEVGSSDMTVFQIGWVTHVFYLDNTRGNLRHASWAPGTSWTFEVLDGAGGANGRVDAKVGYYSSGALRSGMHVFYYDVTSKDLRGVQIR